MARLNIRMWLEAFVRLLEGNRVPRQLQLSSRVEGSSVVTPAAPLRDPEGPQIQAKLTSRPDRARVARAFDAAHPVRARHELFGRAQELDALLSATLDFGQHAIIHGARGSGKTSLVRVYGDHADQRGAMVIYMACEPDATFAELVGPYLRSLPAVALAPEERNRFRDGLADLPEQFRPRTFVELVAERLSAPVVFIFDEFDRITDVTVKADMAAAMKLLSDSLTSVIFVLVGIAGNVSDVIDSHQSLRRHMRVISVGRIEADSVNALIDAGESATGLIFEENARLVIAKASCGSPFHVRMFCNHAATAAIERGSSSVSDSDVRAGLLHAIEQWAGMNPEDALRFVALVERKELLPEIEQLAKSAALHDRLSAGTSDVQGLLEGTSLIREPGGDALVFRDSVAPQFLMAYAILAEAASSSLSYNPPRRTVNAPDR